MRGRSCTLVVEDGGQTETIEAVIEEVFTEGEAEYVRLDDDRRVRLDRIRQRRVSGGLLRGYAC